jgi:hypothetical protein
VHLYDPPQSESVVQVAHTASSGGTHTGVRLGGTSRQPQSVGQSCEQSLLHTPPVDVWMQIPLAQS